MLTVGRAAVVRASDEVPAGTATEAEALCRAAEACLAAADAGQALHLFEAAYRMCADQQRRSAIVVRLAHILWQFNPAAAERLIGTRLAAPADTTTTAALLRRSR